MAASAASRRPLFCGARGPGHSRLAGGGPGVGASAGRPDQGSSLHNLKELRPGSVGASEIRVLFIFDPERKAVLLVAGDKAGNWSGWYRTAIGRAEQRYKKYLDERERI
ncbi:type II toxin-antitoxin system RelE/ParE family toxin [Nocardia sp. N2S4-5]|uniref:type II toxin-antitoxin system RelE/ParE family toxin n=1 Tax=Nocardia sp. N2S4-5 TaxID=3351565 RepID=UPI0037D13F3C